MHGLTRWYESWHLPACEMNVHISLQNNPKTTHPESFPACMSLVNELHFPSQSQPQNPLTNPRSNPKMAGSQWRAESSHDDLTWKTKSHTPSLALRQVTNCTAQRLSVWELVRRMANPCAANADHVQLFKSLQEHG